MNRHKDHHSSLLRYTRASALLSLLLLGALSACSKVDSPAEPLPKQEDKTLNEKAPSTPPSTPQAPKDSILKDTITPKDTIPSVPKKEEIPLYTLSELEGMTYEFEVVFHLLSSPRSELNNRFTSERADSILARVNALYAGKSGGEDAKVRFVLASKQPDGTPMLERGILRKSISEEKLSYFRVTNDSQGGEYHSQSWDTKRYINVYIFMFSEFLTRGVSTYPDLTDEHPLAGLKTYHPSVRQIQHTCIAINEVILGSWRADTKKGVIATAPQARTLAHEFGHYLGLYHVFRGQNNPEDYCDDTKDYDRPSYEANSAAIRKEIGKLSAQSIDGTQNVVDQLVKRLYMRKPLDGSAEYESVNIMDYDTTYGNQFTKEQVKRMRHCLYYSPTLPGPKVSQPKETSLRAVGLRQASGSRSVACTVSSSPFLEE